MNNGPRNPGVLLNSVQEQETVLRATLTEIANEFFLSIDPQSGDVEALRDQAIQELESIIADNKLSRKTATGSEKDTMNKVIRDCAAAITKLRERKAPNDDTKKKDLKSEKTPAKKILGSRLSGLEENLVQLEIQKSIEGMEKKFLTALGKPVPLESEDLEAMQNFFSDPIAYLGHEYRTARDFYVKKNETESNAATKQKNETEIALLDTKLKNLDYYKKTFAVRYEEDIKRLQEKFSEKEGRFEYHQNTIAEKKELAELEKLFSDPRGIEGVIHGNDVFDENGELVGSDGWGRPDLDAQGLELLCELAGIKLNRLTVVSKGDRLTRTEQLERTQKENDTNPPAGVVNFDTSGKDGATIEPDGTVTFDHHDPKRKDRFTSATEGMYRMLMKMPQYREKLLPVNGLEQYITLVNRIDNLSYLDSEIRKNFDKKWSHTPYGVSKSISAKDMLGLVANRFTIMKDKIDFGKPFTSNELAIVVNTIEDPVTRERTGGMPLREICNDQQKKVFNSGRGITKAEKKMEALDITFDHPVLGKVLINFIEYNNNTIPLGATAAYAKGYDTYIAIRQKNVFTSSKKDLAEVEKELSKVLPSKLIRSNMIATDYEKNNGHDVDVVGTLTAMGIPVDEQKFAEYKQNEFEEFKARIAEGFLKLKNPDAIRKAEGNLKNIRGKITALSAEVKTNIPEKKIGNVTDYEKALEDKDFFTQADLDHQYDLVGDTTKQDLYFKLKTTEEIKRELIKVFKEKLEKNNPSKK